MSRDMPIPPALLIERLTVKLPDGRLLFDDAELQIQAGEFVLLVGVSGSGKTTLLRRIADLDEPNEEPVLATSGRILVGGEPAGSALRQPVGLVFQNLALFDELSAVDNIRFALDHRAGERGSSVGEAKVLLERLRVPTDGRLATLSGGERQRVAVARTLALDPPILLFDEPTTGLDPGRARAVADLIVETHRQSHKTVLVVTHDVAPFLPHQPRFILLDAAVGKMRDVPESELRTCFTAPVPSSAAPTTASSNRHRPGTRDILRLVDSPGRTLLTLFSSVVFPLTGWRRPRWKLRYFWHYLRMVALGSTAVYVAVAGVMLGFVTVSFTFRQLPYGQVTVPLLTEEFLAAAGYSSFRVLVPLLIAVLMAGKCGAAVAADLGARRLTHQYEAMRSFGIRPEQYLYGNIVAALLIAGPLLTFLAFISSTYASLIGFLLSSPEATPALFWRNYFSTMWPITSALPSGTGWVALKAATGGLLVAGLSYRIGSRPKQSSVEVSRDVGSTIFWASLAVLSLHSFYSFVEF